MQLIRQTKSYAVNNYIGVILSGFSAQILPSLIVRHLGAPSAAYFSMAWTMANLLYIVPSATTQSLLAESSHDPEKKSQNLKQTVRILTMILGPAVILSVLVAPLLMKVFGSQYSNGSTLIFQILAVSTVFIAVSSVGNTMLNIERRSGGIIAAQASKMVVTLGSVTFLWRYGLPGVGIAMALGYAASNAVHIYLRKKRRAEDRRQILGIQFPANRSSLEQLLSPYGISNFSYAEMDNGSSNRTFFIRDESGDMVLRVYRHRKRTGEQIADEIAFIGYLKSRSLPVPTILPTVRGIMAPYTTIGSHDWQYLLMRFEDGSHAETYTPVLLSSMARLQAAMHRAGAQFAHGQAAGRLFGAPGSKLFDRLAGKFLPRGYSHFDFDATNILVGQTGKVRCILDFEGMRYGPLVVCLYYTLTRIYGQQQDMAELKNYLYDYQRVRRLKLLEKIALGVALTIHTRKLSLLSVSHVQAAGLPA